MTKKLVRPEDKERKDGLKEVSMDIPGAAVPSGEPVATNRGAEAMQLVNAMKSKSGPTVGKKPEPVIDREAPVERRQVGSGVKSVTIAKYVSFELGGVKKEFLPGKVYSVERDVRALLMEAGVVAK